jgi:multiple sugar transport system substrate-binding protein
MQLKKLVGMFTAVLLMVSLLAGCGGANKEEPSKQSNSTASSSSETAAKTEKKETIELSVGFGAGDEAATKSLEQLAKEYNEKDTDYRIKLDPIAGDFNDAIKTRMASNTEPDIWAVDPAQIPSLVESSRILALDDYLGDYDVADFEKAPFEAMKYQGKTYALPIDYNTLILFYNKKMLQEAGVEVPKTWDELKEAAKELTNSKVKGLSLQNELARFQPFFYSNGGTMMKDDKPSVNSKENAEAFGFWISLFKDEVAATPADLGVGWNGDAFGQQLVAMTIEGHWMAPYIAKLDPNLEWGMASIPIKNQPASMVFFGGYAASANTKNKEGAADIIKFLASAHGIQAKVDQGGGGVIPARQSMRDDFLKKSPEKQAAVEAVEHASLFIYGLKGPDVIKQMNDMAQEILLGKQTDPQTALDKVQQQLDK